MYYRRTLEKMVRQASCYFKVVIITGPRQVGKTTLFRHIMEPGRRYVSLDDAAALILAREDPEGFFLKFPPPVLIDEVQKAPNLFGYIKHIVDESQDRGQIWLTGSQIFTLMENLADSLAGRVAVLNLQGFSMAEQDGDYERPLFSPEISLDRKGKKLSKNEVFARILRGGYPQLLDGTPRDLYFSSYLNTYIQRDVKNVVNVTKELSFIKFIKVLAARTGQVLNYNDISRDIEVSAPTVKSWVSVLATSGLIYLLPPFGGNLSQRSIKSPKCYFLDTGLCCYLCGLEDENQVLNSSMSGALFETFVVSELLKSFWHHGKTPFFYFYRNSDNNQEVDLIIEQMGKVWPVEIKLSSTPDLKMARHFKVLDKVERGQGLIICTAGELMPLSKDVWVVPVGMI